jgi:hypothetical protein
LTLAMEHPVRRNTDRVFFSGMAILVAATVLVGFSPTYFLRDSTLTPLTPLYHLHGAVFTSWITLLVIQTWLVAGYRTDIHRRLGIAGAVLAAAVFLIGVTVSIETLRRGGGGAGGLDARRFLAIPLGDILVFGTLATAAILLRRHVAAHKRLMLLATISLATAAVARSLAQIHAGSLVGLFLGTDIFVAAVIAYDFMSRGRVHPATLSGAAMVALFKPALLAFSATPAWLVFADSLR